MKGCTTGMGRTKQGPPTLPTPLGMSPAFKLETMLDLFTTTYSACKNNVSLQMLPCQPRSAVVVRCTTGCPLKLQLTLPSSLCVLPPCKSTCAALLGLLQYSTAPGSDQCHRSALASQPALKYHMCASGNAVGSGTHHPELMSLE
jgi:hypothetical protein